MGSKTNTQTQSYGPPPQVMSAYNDLLARAQQVASTPYQQYTGQLLAPFSGSQQAAFNTIDDAQGIAQPYIDQASQYATQGASAISPDQIAQYYNPYQADVVRATQANFDESNARQLAQVRGNAIAKGALGGDRNGVAMGEAIRQQQLAQAPVIAGLQSQGFTSALSAAQQDAMRQGQAAYTFGNLGQTAQNTTLTGAQAQLGSGALLQQHAQAGLSIPYQQWLEQQAFPYQQTGWLSGIATGVGSNMGGTSTTQTPGPNIFSQLIGGGLAAAGAAGGMGWKPFAASGGRINGYAEGGIAHPWGDAAKWVPGASLVRGSGPAPRQSSGAREDDSVSRMVSNATSMAKSLRGDRGIGAPLSLAAPGMDMSAGMSPASSGIAPTFGMSALYRRGGMVMPEENGIFVPRGYAMGGEPELSPIDRINMGFGEADAAIAEGVMDPVGANQGTPTLGYSGTIPLPRPRPSEADVEILDAQGPAGIAAPAYAPVDAPAYAAPAGIGVAPSATAQPTMNDRFQSIAPALISAGFGMMASRSPFLGTAIGEGGLAGLQTYQQGKATERDEAHRDRQHGLQARGLDMQVKRLDQSAKEAAARLDLQTQQQAETARHNQATENAPRVVGPSLVKPDGTVVHRASNALLDDETVDAMAGQYLAGDKSVMQNLGRGAQGAENIVRLRAAIQRQAKDQNLSPAQLAVKMAEFQGLAASQRTLGNRVANVELAVTEAQNLMPQVLQTSEKVDRTKYPALNNIILAAERGTGDENTVRFGIAVNSLINVYARAISPTGVPTVSDKDHARELLSTAWSKGQVRAAIDQLNLEMEAARRSPGQVKEAIRDLYSDKKHEAPAPAAGAAPAIGTEKKFKQGVGVWDGTKWVPKAAP